jgi:hypothetical protein
LRSNGDWSSAADAPNHVIRFVRQHGSNGDEEGVLIVGREWCISAAGDVGYTWVACRFRRNGSLNLDGAIAFVNGRGAGPVDEAHAVR